MLLAESNVYVNALILEWSDVLPKGAVFDFRRGFTKIFLPAIFTIPFFHLSSLLLRFIDHKPHF